MPGRLGIPDSSLSGYEKFEAPDPAEWTARGYAVVNIDSRGAWDSEGYLWYVNSWKDSSHLFTDTLEAGLVLKRVVMAMMP